jgi:putative membrane protein
MTRDPEPTQTGLPSASLFALGVRGALGGLLMGLANLVPGISGGTMLLAAGVYPAFIEAIAELTTLRFRVRSIVLLASIAGTAALGILLLAGVMRELVIEQRWVMYSIFIGLTLGGVPLVWKLARPASTGVVIGAIAAFAGMVVMNAGFGGDESAGQASALFLLISGLAGASAMILPGVSGGYLLLLLGQYEVILGAIDTLKQGLIGRDLALVMESMTVVIPVGIGVVIGIVGVSNLLKWLLARFEKPTLGALLGLLFGAVVGLWPFQQPIAPLPGELFEGTVLTAEAIALMDVEDYRLVRFDPSAGQATGAVALVVLGIAATALVARVGGAEGDRADEGEGHAAGREGYGKG